MGTGRSIYSNTYTTQFTTLRSYLWNGNIG